MKGKWLKYHKISLIVSGVVFGLLGYVIVGGLLMSLPERIAFLEQMSHWFPLEW